MSIDDKIACRELCDEVKELQQMSPEDIARYCGKNRQQRRL